MKWPVKYMDWPPSADPEPTWHALPGGILELGTTGFQIRLSHDLRMPTYMGTDPEGRTLVAGHNLESMRQSLDACAQWRREFEPAGGRRRCDAIGCATVIARTHRQL